MLLHYISGRLLMNTCGTSSKMLVELLQFEYCMISLLENHGSSLLFSPYFLCLVIVFDDKFLLIAYCDFFFPGNLVCLLLIILIEDCRELVVCASVCLEGHRCLSWNTQNADRCLLFCFIFFF